MPEEPLPLYLFQCTLCGMRWMSRARDGIQGVTFENGTLVLKFHTHDCSANLPAVNVVGESKDAELDVEYTD